MYFSEGSVDVYFLIIMFSPVTTQISNDIQTEIEAEVERVEGFFEDLHVVVEFLDISVSETITTRKPEDAPTTQGAQMQTTARITKKDDTTEKETEDPPNTSHSIETTQSSTYIPMVGSTVKLTESPTVKSTEETPEKTTVEKEPSLTTIELNNMNTTIDDIKGTSIVPNGNLYGYN